MEIHYLINHKYIYIKNKQIIVLKYILKELVGKHLFY